MADDDPARSDVASVVLVHGAWGDPRDWDDVVAALTPLGVRALSADLPTMRDAGANALDDADHVAALAATAQGPVVLCGHSYGGVVVTQAAASVPDVTHLVYVAAVVPDVGESMADVVGRGPTSSTDGLEVRPDGSTVLTGWAAADWDYPADALARMARYERRAFAPGGRTTEVTAAGWRDVPSTYVVAERDASIAAVRQRAMATRCGRVVSFDSGHMVVHEHPVALAHLLAEVAGSVAPVAPDVRPHG